MVDSKKLPLKSFRHWKGISTIGRRRWSEETLHESHARFRQKLSSQVIEIRDHSQFGRFIGERDSVRMESLAKKIENNNSKQAVANLSTLESLEAYTPMVDRPVDNVAKVKLFRHNQPILDAAVDETFYLC